jgi:GNAT superfamily N-acetyltransferase
MHGVRPATPADVGTVASTLASAFHDDPVWGWVFDDVTHRTERLTIWWRFWIEAVLDQQWVWMTEGGEAAAVWVTPGNRDAGPDDVARIESLLEELLGPRAALACDVIACFEEAYPKAPPHYYLEMLGTHREHWGNGIGMRLLADTLARVDREHMPCFLESSNPANIPRYETVGFVPTNEFTLPHGGPTLTQMWREAR